MWHRWRQEPQQADAGRARPDRRPSASKSLSPLGRGGTEPSTGGFTTTRPGLRAWIHGDTAGGSACTGIPSHTHIHTLSRASFSLPLSFPTASAVGRWAMELGGNPTNDGWAETDREQRSSWPCQPCLQVERYKSPESNAARGALLGPGRWAAGMTTRTVYRYSPPAGILSSNGS